MQDSIHGTTSSRPVLTAMQRDRVFALHKVNEALTTISTAYTRHEGIYRAFADNLLALEELDHLPPPTLLAVVEFFKKLSPSPDLDRIDQARKRVAKFTECQALRFIDDLLGLRRCLERTVH